MCANGLLLLLVASAGYIAAEPECQNGMLYPAESADQYYYCIGGVRHLATCPDGTYFDATFLVCRLEKHPPSPSPEVTSTTPSPEPNVSGKCARPGLSADLTSCNRYYHCANKGDLMELSICPKDYNFNQARLACDTSLCR